MARRRAFSYTRFSTAKQAEGFSLARQLAAAKAYCERNGLTLDERSFCDMGVSGFHGANAVDGELFEFLSLVRGGRVPKGSVLIVENTDRLSRLPPDEANRIITEIVRAGVDVVTTSPEQVYTAANIDKLGTWLPLQVSNCLAREESEKKSARLKDAWARKRAAIANGKKLTTRGPFWLRWDKSRGGWEVKEREADLMRRVFQWCIEGEGAATICERLHREYPQGVTGKGWQPNNVRKLLRSRHVIGEFQPVVGTSAKKGGIKSTRRPAGQPVAGYFPAIVDEATYYKAQQALDGRKRGGGRITGTPNLFNGLLVNAVDGQKMVLNTDHGKRVLVSGGAIRKMKGSEFVSVPYDILECAILKHLRELRASDVMGTTGKTEDAVEQWSNKLTAVNYTIERTQQRVAGADDPTVFLDLLEKLGTERKAIIAGLEEAKAGQSTSPSDALGECSSLIDLLASAKPDERDELRRRLKGALRRLIDGMFIVLAGKGRYKLAQIQIWFRSGTYRSYNLYHRPARNDIGASQEARTYSVSVSEKDRTGLSATDLRESHLASAVKEALENTDREQIESLLSENNM